MSGSLSTDGAVCLCSIKASKLLRWDTNVSQNNILQTATEMYGLAVENKINTTQNQVMYPCAFGLFTKCEHYGKLQNQYGDIKAF